MNRGNTWRKNTDSDDDVERAGGRPVAKRDPRDWEGAEQFGGRGGGGAWQEARQVASRALSSQNDVKLSGRCLVHITSPGKSTSRSFRYPREQDR